jgi:2,4-dienoyl-CoA reductase (NADPH2)
MKTLSNLFTPIKIGELELNNRIVMAPMGLGYASDGKVGERLLNFYAARAKGGAGLIIAAIAVNYYGPRFGEALYSTVPLICDDSFLPGIRQLAEVAHQNGAKVAVQLTAQFIWKKTVDSVAETVGPSDMPKRPGTPETRALSEEEIQQLVELCGDAARRARDAGIDAVEFHAMGGESVSAQFLSPIRNHRTDKYGGSLENRARFLLECIENARRKAGDDYTFLCRYSGEDFVEGGMTLEEAKLLGTMLEKSGVHALDISTGLFEAPVPFIQMSVPRGAFVYLAEAVKNVVGIPVIGGVRVNDPILADRLIGEGRVDMVYMARALLADPDFPNKTREGLSDDICPCIACGHCLDVLLGEGKPVECAVNPQVGREAEYVIEEAAEPKTVVVVGGGPAGMEAAIVATERGHRVTLIEKQNQLGGNLLFAAIPPHKEEITNYISYLINQVKKSKIEIMVGENDALKFIQVVRPDVVILATGAQPAIPKIRGITRDNVISALEVLGNPGIVGDRVVVVGGGLIGCETAEVLVNISKKVTVLEMLPRIGSDVGVTSRWVLLRRLRGKGVVMETNAEAKEIVERGVRASRNSTVDFFEADTVVLAVGMTSERELEVQLGGKVEALYKVGDCVEPGRIVQATRDAFRIAFQI